MNRGVKYPQFGNFLRKLREDKDWTQRDVAERLGIPQPTWAGYEQGRRLPEDNELLTKIAEVFEIPFEELRKVLPDDVLTPRERISYFIEEYRQQQKRMSKIGEQLTTGKGRPEELLAELNDVRDKLKRTTQHLSKAFMELYPLRPVPIVSIKAVARFHGGHPFEIIDIDPNDVEAVITVPEDHPANIALRVVGDSLIEAGINDGDYVLIDTTATPKDGDLVAVRLNGDEGVIKYYRKKNGEVWLYPANKNYEPIKITEEMNAIIVGVARGVWKHTPSPPPEVWEDGSEKEANAR